MCRDVSAGGKAISMLWVGVNQLTSDVGMKLLVKRSNL